MLEGIEIDGRAGSMIAQVNRRATNRTEGVTPIVKLTLINRFDHDMKVAGEIDQEWCYGLSTSERNASSGDPIALDANCFAILAGRPTVMAAD